MTDSGWKPLNLNLHSGNRRKILILSGQNHLFSKIYLNFWNKLATERLFRTPIYLPKHLWDFILRCVLLIARSSWKVAYNILNLLHHNFQIEGNIPNSPKPTPSKQQQAKPKQLSGKTEGKPDIEKWEQAQNSIQNWASAIGRKLIWIT